MCSSRYYYRRRPLTWVIFSILVTVAIILSATISVHYTTSDYTDDDGLRYSLTDTRIIPVTNGLCQGLEMTLDGGGSDSGYTAHLYMLNSPPQLTGHEEFSIHDSVFIAAEEFHYYYYYMYPGSHFTVSVCESSVIPLSGTFKLIQGSKNFKRWQRGSYSVPSQHNLAISTCEDSNATLSYKVDVEGYYYFILESGYTYSIQPTIYISFYRTRYEIDVSSNTTIADSCEELTGGYLSVSCSVSVPFSGQTAYLAIVPEDSTSVDWLNGISVGTSCQPRLWVYVVISISALIGALAVVVPVVICACMCMNKNKRRAQTTLPADNAPLLNDPVINPQTQQSPTGYGTNYGAPPV